MDKLIFAIFAFWFTGAIHAATAGSITKYFIVPEVGTGNPVIIGAGGFEPANKVTDAPVDASGFPYPIEAIDIVDEPTPGGIVIKVARLNQKKYETYLKRVDDDKDKDKAAKKLKDDRKERIRIGCALEKGELLKEICQQVLEP